MNPFAQLFPNANSTTTPPSVPSLPKPVAPTACPVEHWLEFLGHRWNALILWHLRAAMRHGELAKRLPGVTPKVLSDRLAALSERGLVARRVGNTFPRAVSYSLTPRGAALLSVLDQLELWSAAEHADQPLT